MKLPATLHPQHEQRSQEIRKERQSEVKRSERLSAMLAKKVGSAKNTGLADKAA
jgi:hypothetical protein